MTLLGTNSVSFKVTAQLLIGLLTLVRYERKNGRTMRQPFINLKKTYNSVRGELQYNIITEFGISMKLVRLIKMCLDETYSKVCIGNLSDMFPIRNDLKAVEDDL
jgi:hypothetical protein